MPAIAATTLVSSKEHWHLQTATSILKIHSIFKLAAVSAPNSVKQAIFRLAARAFVNASTGITLMKALGLAYNLPSITKKILLFIPLGEKKLATRITGVYQGVHRFQAIHVYKTLFKLTSKHYPDLQRSTQDLSNRLFFI
ncbi:MAG TPA: hypothetical protein V6D15_08155 [Oculatellaceae cyanobacterium]